MAFWHEYAGNDSARKAYLASLRSERQPSAIATRKQNNIHNVGYIKEKDSWADDEDTKELRSRYTIGIRLQIKETIKRRIKLVIGSKAIIFVQLL